MPSKKPSPDQNANKATSPGSKPASKKTLTPKPTKATPAPVKAASKWRTVSPAQPVEPIPEPTPVIPAKPLSPFQRWAQGEGAFDEFISFVLDGGHMADFCRDRSIAYTTMYDWVRTDPRRAELYVRAREDRAEKFADEIVAISDESTVVAKYQGEEVVLVLDAAAVSRNKLRVDARKWIAAKLKPRTYGDKVQVEQTVDHRVLPDDALLSRLALFGIALPGIVPKPPVEEEA